MKYQIIITAHYNEKGEIQSCNSRSIPNKSGFHPSFSMGFEMLSIALEGIESALIKEKQNSQEPGQR